MIGAQQRNPLAGIEKVKVKTVAVGEHHNMGCPPDMRH